MKIIISPAKKMREEGDLFPCDRPVFLKEAEFLRDSLKRRSFEELKTLWKCSEKIARQNVERLESITFEEAVTPALLAYEGIQYQYMAPQVFTERQWEYVEKRLRILSGLYGTLKPRDGVIPYRLEMQARLETDRGKDLYEFWGEKLYQEIGGSGEQILNLASKEYSRVIEKYVEKPENFITCVFGERSREKIKVKGTQAKMARGEMVRWLAETGIEEKEEIKGFSGLGYRYAEEYSSDRELIFLKEPEKGEA